MSPSSTTSTVQLNNGKANNNMSKANSEDTDDPTTPVIRNLQYSFYFNYFSFSPIQLVLIWAEPKRLRMD